MAQKTLQHPPLSLPIAMEKSKTDTDNTKIANSSNIWNEMSQLTWSKNSLIPMLLEARKFREEEKIEEARQIIKRIQNMQTIRKIEEEEGFHSKIGADEVGSWSAVDLAAVKEEMCSMNTNIQGNTDTQAGWSKLWKCCLGQRKREQHMSEK